MKLAQKEEILKYWENEVQCSQMESGAIEKYTLTVTNFRLIWEERKTSKKEIDRTEVETEELARQEVLLSGVKGFSYNKVNTESTTKPKSAATRIFFAIVLAIVGFIFLFTGLDWGVGIGMLVLFFALVLFLIPKGEAQVEQHGFYQLSIYVDTYKSLNIAGKGEGVVNICITQADLLEIADYLGAYIAEGQKKK